MIQTVFLQPLDILVLRANKLFGDAGSYGESMALPRPSVVAGAIRSRLMADYGLAAQTWLDPEQFTLAGLGIAQKLANNELVTAHTLPADVLVQQAADGGIRVQTLKPQILHPGLQSSGGNRQLAVLAETTRVKAESGYWLNSAGWTAYLAGKQMENNHLIETSTLWKMDNRVGVGLNESSRAADDGKLFTTQAVAFEKDTGFIVAFDSPHILKSGLLRLGGDGRAAAIQAANVQSPMVDFNEVAKGKRFRLILTTPGIFPGGWKLPGLGDDNLWQFDGIKARLISAAVPRAEVVSGWDLAARKPNGEAIRNGAPKPAQRAAPTGSVYWLELLEGSADAAHHLRNISDHGLWDLPGQTTDAQRRAEGFNRCTVASWSD